MYALVDGNCFYASCERVFRPDLKHKPVVVLSNNDGCVVARSQEAKDLGVAMAVPYFKVAHLVRSGQLTVFSSNYELYADMSRRMMTTIQSLAPAIEVYSIDECFADLSGLPQLRAQGVAIRQRVAQWLGLPTCVGIAPTKTLAKFCNHLAKKHGRYFEGVVVWGDWSEAVRRRALQSEPATTVWGIGRRLGRQLAEQGIVTAWDVHQADTATLRQRYGVVVERVQRELQGVACEGMVGDEPRQQILRSRSFAHDLTELAPLQAAISHHVSEAAGLLRAQGSQAQLLHLFLYGNRYGEERHQAYESVALVQPSADTLLLNQQAQTLLKKAYRRGRRYKKCGIALAGLSSGTQGVQADLWTAPCAQKSEAIMGVLDAVRQHYGRGSVRLGSELLSDEWFMQQAHLSPCFTTRFEDLLVCA
ncbi:MAG: Y-family DNA polymerase [Neisseriaceae bacterium]|nr:Y-family DNA polymerase [Neisseriaceae bacterium]